MDTSTMIFTVFIAATVLLVVFTFLPIWRYQAWWVRSLDFPRFQLSIVLSIIIGFEWVLLDFSLLSSWILIIFALACLVYQLWWIAPYTPFFPFEVKSATTLDSHGKIRIMTANILASNRNSAALIKLVHENEPDILVSLESDKWWQSKLDTLETDYPYTIKCPQENLYGMHVYSKLALSDSHIDFLVEPDVPSMHSLVRLQSGQQIRMHFLHPAPPSPTENDESSERDAELLIVAKSVRNAHIPVIVTGDLNDVAWSETTRLFRKISGLLDPRVGRGMFNTFHAGYWFIRWPLDHLFHSEHFTLSKMRRLRYFGSDHFAILAELVFEANKEPQKPGLNADADDLAWAQAMANEQDVSKKDVPEPGSR
ncbi:endonuclease/exonuclease/phosphatase family protein [Desulfosarcina sp.]|uniref:endonuclease/exonuclease/phosphatase family protein n=1 Tax=Desulfosarcina sp. TaxID=2027861 RepID=UPI003563B8C7